CAADDPRVLPRAGHTRHTSKSYKDHGSSQQRIMTLHEAVVEAGLDSPYADWLERRSGMEDRSAKVTTRIECAQYFANRDQALLAHATQIDPDGFFFAVPRDIERRVWPYEEYELARSLVDSEVPEDDLFAGLRK